LARILITSGPTRQYLDPVRYLTNASSGRMGKALAEAALAAGHDVVLVSGPVEVTYPSACRVVPVVSTEDLLAACEREFPTCDGVIGVAAPCDYRPRYIAAGKIAKTGDVLRLELIETPDVMATLGALKAQQWLVGFALETEDQRLKALAKAERKSCDLMVLNGPSAMHALETSVEVLDRSGATLGQFVGSKTDVARQIFNLIQSRLIARRR
jgi:phosphopantothenoylcysteine decarboxylase / phosphopantothenate---cysteine ligase